MAPPRTKPVDCIVPGCPRRADVAGTARGWCIAHYNRWRRYGWCESAHQCARLATNHFGLCDEHTPQGVAI
jgi:hypothetical protein